MKKYPIYKLCNKKSTKTKIGITIDVDLLEIIDDEATDEKITRSEMINRRLRMCYREMIK